MPASFMPQPPVSSRPQMPRYRESDTPDMNPDLIIRMPDTDDFKNIQYLCFKFAAEAKRTNCWRILRVCEEFSGTFQEYVTTFKYPFGCASYDFNPDHIWLIHDNQLDWEFDFKR
jgi:hypothetical protein